tara:strand:- start:2764 stop:3186 length:423 start_codon:yes stop_codon:yes gene_type:complete
MKSIINEHDITKTIIQKLNESKKLIREQEESEGVSTTTDKVNLSSDNKEQLKKLTEFLGTADIRDNTISVDNEEGRATWNGRINNIINFTMNAGGNPNDRLIIKMDGVPVDGDIAGIIVNLVKFADSWSQEILSQSGDLK